MPPECNRCGLYHGSDKTCGEVRAAIVEQTQQLAASRAKEDHLSTLSARVVEAAVEASQYERDMDPDERVERYGARFSVDESCRHWEALDAAVDALIAAREGG